MITYSQLGQYGRLGNMLWQIAGTIGIAHELGEKVSLPPWEYQEFFSIPEEIFSGEDGEEAALLSELPEERRWYMQDISLWWSIREQIWEWFQPSEVARAALIGRPLGDEFVSVHVRCNDMYHQANLYVPVWRSRYYDRAFELVPRWKVFFSDDMNYCVSRWGWQTEATFMPSWTRPMEWLIRQGTPVTDWIDLFHQAALTHHVIANSTYSWWGAFLSKDPSPIYPTSWFGPDIQAQGWSLLDFMPDGWRGVDVD